MSDQQQFPTEISREDPPPAHPFTGPQLDHVRDKLLDKSLIQKVYGERTLREAAKELGTTRRTFRRALLFHGIPIRKRGQRPVGRGLTRERLHQIVARAYDRVGRCPPACPGRESCLDEGVECIMAEARERGSLEKSER